MGYSPWGCKEMDMTERLHSLSLQKGVSSSLVGEPRCHKSQDVVKKRSREISELGRKVMTNLDSILKSRDITLPTKVRLVKAICGFSFGHVWM